MDLKRSLSISLLSFSFYLLSSQVPQGFNYQAIARDGAGNPIINATIKVKLSVLSDTSGFYATGGGTYIWEEEQPNVKTNAFGLFTLVFGNPAATKVQGSASGFSSIPWSVNPLYLGTKIANPSVYKNMGSAQLWTVPYSMLSGGLSGSLSKLTVKGNSVSRDSALFEVKNVNGETVFAVYDEGVRINVGDGLVKGSTKGGFAIGELAIVKAPGQEYFRVTRDSTRVYVNPLAKGTTKGGFAIGGFDGLKGSNNNYLNLTPNNYFIGQQAGFSNTTGLYNSFMGYQSGYYNNIGEKNIFLGYQSGFLNTSGSNNIIAGHMAGYKNSTGSWNIILGDYAGYANKKGFSNVIIGNMAGNQCNADDNVFIGEQSGSTDSLGKYNTAVGGFSASSNSSGEYNTAIGFQTGRMNSTGSNNALLGSNAGYRLMGSFNTAVGTLAGYSLSGSTGSGNVFIGYYAGYNELGSNKLYIANGQSNTLVYGEFDNHILRVNGDLYAQSTLLNNSIEVNSANSGNRNAYIDFHGDDFYTDFGLRLIRTSGGLNATSNLVHRGTGEFNTDAPDGGFLTFSTYSTERLRIASNGYIGVGTVTPGTKLNISSGNWDVFGGEGDFRIGDGTFRFKIGVANDGSGAGDVRMTAHGGTNRLIMGGGGKDILLVNSTDVVPWTDNFSSLGLATNRWKVVYAVNGTIQTSDQRLKTNISDIGYGLETILKLRPVSFTWKDDSQNTLRLGLIAQDVQKVINEVVDKGSDPNQTLGINYSEITPVLIKGIQEENLLIESVQKENAELRKSNEVLLQRLKTLESKMEEIETHINNGQNK
jgi:trimeric autotransporter adhesin